MFLLQGEKEAVQKEEVKSHESAVFMMIESHVKMIQSGRRAGISKVEIRA